MKKSHKNRKERNKAKRLRGQEQAKRLKGLREKQASLDVLQQALDHSARMQAANPELFAAMTDTVKALADESGLTPEEVVSNGITMTNEDGTTTHRSANEILLDVSMNHPAFRNATRPAARLKQIQAQQAIINSGGADKHALATALARQGAVELPADFGKMKDFAADHGSAEMSLVHEPSLDGQRSAHERVVAGLASVDWANAGADTVAEGVMFDWPDAIAEQNRRVSMHNAIDAVEAIKRNEDSHHKLALMEQPKSRMFREGDIPVVFHELHVDGIGPMVDDVMPSVRFAANRVLDAMHPYVEVHDAKGAFLDAKFGFRIDQPMVARDVQDIINAEALRIVKEAQDGTPESIVNADMGENVKAYFQFVEDHQQQIKDDIADAMMRMSSDRSLERISQDTNLPKKVRDRAAEFIRERAEFMQHDHDWTQASDLYLEHAASYLDGARRELNRRNAIKADLINEKADAHEAKPDELPTDRLA